MPRAHLVAQPRRSFGARLERALGAGHRAGRRVVLIGSDSPTLPPAFVRLAFARLRSVDCVLGPSTDGGYYLIGARRPLPRSLLSGIPWSTGQVFPETLRRARAARLRLALLPRWYDVDDADGLRRIARDSEGLRRATATRAALGGVHRA